MILQPNLANFVRLAGVGGHQLLYHPASITDIQRDADIGRRERTLRRIEQYTRLEGPAICPWNTAATAQNDACDNEILYALGCDAAHALVSEDRDIHAKAKIQGLADRVYNIQTAEDWLRRLHEAAEIHLPNIEDVALHSLTPNLDKPFYDSLRDAYDDFNNWFRVKAREGRHAWIYRDERREVSAICIYAAQVDERINDTREVLIGRALKLCTFKVGELVRGRKVGELFLKAAFRYASENACEHIFIHVDVDRHSYLIQLLEEFGFEHRGEYEGDQVFVKDHPKAAPDVALPALEYARKFFPHYRRDAQVKKYLIPIQPHFHEVLFPDYISPTKRQLALFPPTQNVGNAIKLAYLCHAQTNSVQAGDIVLFYRTHDERAVTTLGIVDRFEVLHDASTIARLVSRRTVYDQREIEEMALKPTKVLLFRLVEHLPQPVSYDRLLHESIVTGPIQSIRRIDDECFAQLLTTAGW